MSYARVGLGSAASDYIAGLAQQHAGDDGGYADRAVRALNMIVGDPATQSALAPMVRTGVSIFEVAQKQWSAATDASGGQLPQVMLGFVNDVTGALAKTSAMVGDAVSAVGEAIPIIGTVVSLWGSAEDMMAQAHSDYMAKIIAACTSADPTSGHYIPVVPTGAGKMMPADIFVARWQGGAPAQTVTTPTGSVIVLAPAVPPTPVATSLGRALIAITEGSPGSIAWAQKFGAKGISADDRAKFRAMRLAIEASAVHPELTDGGQKIWPIYLDLLRAKFDDGSLTPAYATYLWVLDGTNGQDASVQANAIAAAQGQFSLMSPYEQSANSAVPYTGYVECKKWDQRAFNAVVKLVSDWRSVALPKWGSDRAALSAQLAASQAAIQALAQAEAQKRLGGGMKITFPPALVGCIQAKGTWKNGTCTTTRQGVKWDPATNTFVPQPLLVVKGSTSPVLAMMLGVAVVGSIAWMAKHRKRRVAA